MSSNASRQSNTIVNTPRRTRLFYDAKTTASEMTRKKLFKAHNIAEATNYRIIQSKMTRRSERIQNRGRKTVFGLRGDFRLKLIAGSGCWQFLRPVVRVRAILQTIWA